MLPSVLSRQTTVAVQQFLQGAFAMATPLFRHPDGSTMLDDFIKQEDSLFKGPYLSLALPFRVSNLPKDHFHYLNMGFTPYAHQARAFERLGVSEPQSSLIATGTSSGKTECFMYPLLNHCAEQNAKGNKQGIKAIIIYPMNALATDQAKRFAKEIGKSAGLTGLSVGLFVGSQEEKPTTRMNPANEEVITSKEVLRDNPPDILLTNYKMLDYLLMRPEDQPLWRYNRPETLQYIVVDELHTFDGAQGTDLACLLRRLQFKLKTPKDHLAFVGTSATVGSDSDELLGYAKDIFNQAFPLDAVITEDRYSVKEYLSGIDVHYEMPYIEDYQQLRADRYDSIESYISAQLELWFAQEVQDKIQRQAADLFAELKDKLGKEFDEQQALYLALGDHLKQHQLFQLLLKQLNGELQSVVQLKCYLAGLYSITQQQAEWMLESMVALISVARRQVEFNVQPFLQVRYQLWLRELRRMVASVSNRPALNFAADLLASTEQKHLPVIHCRDCHATGWTGLLPTSSQTIETDLDQFYNLFFSDDPSVVFLFPDTPDYKQGTTATDQIRGERIKLCPNCLTKNKLSMTSCQQCHHTDLLSVVMAHDTKEKKSQGVSQRVIVKECPRCGSQHGLSLLGSRAASLTSVMIHQMYGSCYNDNKKLITFSDSVQDAAHRAGFFSTRTWDLMLRGTIAKTLASFKDGCSLDELQNEIPLFARAGLSPEHYVATYLPTDMDWMSDFHQMKETGLMPAVEVGHKNLAELVDLRLGWEVINELGLRSAIGRSLDNTCYATAAVSSGTLKQVQEIFSQRLKEEVASLSTLTPMMLNHFIIGVLERLRRQGAIYHPAFETYIRGGEGHTFYLNHGTTHSFYMRSLGPQSRKPTYFSIERIGGSYSPVFKSRSAKTWFQQWLAKTLAVDLNVFLTNDIAAIYRELVEVLEQCQVLTRYDVRGKHGWALRPKALNVTLQTEFMQCDQCGHHHTIPQDQLGLWQDCLCLNETCHGHYQRASEKGLTDWAQYDTHKVIAAEHTGLLQRTMREQVENSFMKPSQPWDPNLLSATPTLEMGINIGDLSSVLLCSVPPNQANYIQRVGRAGRKDGNAFNATLAQGQSHDLYFYAEPLEMMAGHVASPGVFMQAVAVLERQLTAFCMDNWVTTGISPAALPKNVKVMLDNVEGNHQELFPFTLISYVIKHKKTLLNEFLSLFPDIGEYGVAHLTAYIEQDGGLVNAILSRLNALKNDRKSLLDKQREIGNAIRRNRNVKVRDENVEEQLEQLLQERSGINQLIRSINDKPTLSFFTDEGLLPNYAFPEAGVTLRSVLWRKNEHAADDDKRYDTISYEYERPAAKAISELAPSNLFYADSHKVKVEQIDLGVSELEQWRFCSNCNYSENTLESEDKYKTCPSCGTPNWSDVAQLTEVVKLRQVYARSNLSKSRISDDNDTREFSFYNRQMLVDFKKEDVNKAFKLDDSELPFGFEFIGKARFRDINFGQPLDDGPDFAVAGEQRKRSGFRVCKECGMVQDDIMPKHGLSCKSQHNLDDPKVYVDCLYLYRELNSEAIRILLPISSFSKGSTTENSFIAAIHMGLKRYFNGDVSHIKAAPYDEPLNEGEGRRHFLAIYDTVPGGTGYLKELMQSPNHLFDMLQLALEHLNECRCNHEHGKDGCYRCIFAYSSSRDMDTISRDRAKEILQQLIERRDLLVETRSLDDIDLSVMIGSELEKKFIEALHETNLPTRMAPKLVNDKLGYELLVSEHLGEKAKIIASWDIEPQVKLGSEQVAVPCEADFIFWPTKEQINIKPIAVFLDGYEYHKDIVEEDAAKRYGVVNSQEFHIWTLGWDDLLKPDAKHLIEYFNQYEVDSTGMVQGVLEQMLDVNKSTLEAQVNNKNNYQLLLTLLTKPDLVRASFEQAGFVSAFYWLDLLKSQDDHVKSKFEHEVQENAPSHVINDVKTNPTYFLGGLNDTLGNSPRNVEVMVCLPHSALVEAEQFPDKPEKFEAVAGELITHVCFDFRLDQNNTYKQALFGFWKLINLLQFLPKASWSARQPARYRDIPSKQPEKSTPKAELSDAVKEWQKELEYCALEGDVQLLVEAELPIAVCGYELYLDEKGIAGTAELAWPDYKVAVLCKDEAEQETAFIAEGWTVLYEPVVQALVARLKEEFQG